MEEKDIDLLVEYKQNQKNIVENIKNTEKLIGVLFQAVHKMPCHDHFWLNESHIYFKKAIAGLILSVSGDANLKTLEKLKQIRESKTQEDANLTKKETEVKNDTTPNGQIIDGNFAEIAEKENLPVQENAEGQAIST